MICKAEKDDLTLQIQAASVQHSALTGNLNAANQVRGILACVYYYLIV